MPDVSLPPVGELVQITDVSGRTMLAVRRGPAETMYSATEGLLMGREDVQSWCRVLVLPDTDDIIEAMTAAAWESDAERVRIDGPWSDQDGACRADWLNDMRAAWAAVRGAAIR